MAQKSMPWPDTSVPGPVVGDGRPYSAAEWDQFWEALVCAMGGATEGVKDRVWNKLACTAPGANQISMNTGMGWVKGHLFWADSAVALTPASAGAGLSRHDSVILRCDWTGGVGNQYTVEAAIKQGDATDPPVMSMVDNAVWELRLYNFIIDDAGAITDLTDERAYCHYATRVSAEMCDDDIATQAELDAHEAGASHDIRYFTEAESDARFAPIAKGVTNGNAHDHTGGAGAPIPTDGVANDAIIATKIASNVDMTAKNFNAAKTGGYTADELMGGGIISWATIWWPFTIGGSDGHRPVDPVTSIANENWHILNGETVNGIVLPNYQGRFPVMVDGVDYTLGSTGGAKTVNLTHQHGTNFATDTEPDHRHYMPEAFVYAEGSMNGPYPALSLYAGAHSHNIYANTQNQAGQSAVENRPPYKSMYLVCKIS